MVTPKTEIMLTTHTKILNENILNKKSSMKTLTITLGQPLRPCQSYPLIFLRKIVYPHKFEKPFYILNQKIKILFFPPDMNRKMWQQMSRSSRDHDKDIRQLFYRFSSFLRPLDNTLQFLYLSKP